MTVRRAGLVGAGLLAGALHGASAQTIPVRVGGEASSLVNVPFDVPLEVDLTARPDVKLGSFVLVLRWNPAVLRFDRGENGTFGDVFANEDSLPLGVARLVGANPVGAAGRVVLGVAHFTPIADAPDTFRLQVAELYAAGTFADLLPSASWANRAYCTGRGRYGDLNSNQAWNAQDALIVLSHAVGIDVTTQGLPLLGDVDGDGVTGARDALIMLSFAVGLDVSPFRVQRIAPGPCGDARRPTFSVAPAQVSMDLGQVARLLAVARDSLGNGLTATDVSWQSSDPSIATVSATGLVTAVGAGTVTIKATRLGASSASATISVADRRVHWVDAFAFAADSDQIGAPELPFQTIPQAVSYAQDGDTIKVRGGRYTDGIVLTKGLVLMGDTAGGRPRPLIAATGKFTTGIAVNTSGRVELHELQFDTLYQGVDVTLAGTLLLRRVLFRSPGAAYFAAVTVDTAGALLVQRSGFFGARVTTYAYSNSAIWVYRVGVVSIDSSIISDFGSDGVNLNSVDSLYVRHSVIRHNYGYGIYACTACFTTGRSIAVVFTGNRMLQNQYGHLWLDQLRSARFDHNHLVGGGYDAVNLYGDSTTLVTFRGDSIETFGGSWFNLYTFDSLSVDSVLARQRQYGYSYASGGRAIAITNSTFAEIEGVGLDIDAPIGDTTYVVLRKVAFLGPDSSSCFRCGSGLLGTRVVLDADTLTGRNLYEVVYADYSRLDFQEVTLDQFYEGLEVYCGSLKLAKATLSRGSWGVEAYGCATTDSLVITQSTLRRHAIYGVYASSVATSVSNTVFEDNLYALDHNCGPLRVTGVSATRGQRAINADGCVAGDSAVVDQSSFSLHDYAVDLYSIPARVTNSTFTDNGASYGHDLQTYHARLVATDNQFVRSTGSYGVYFYTSAGTARTARLERNTVTCSGSTTEGLYVDRGFGLNQDSAFIANNTVSGCDGGINIYGPWREVAVRGNAVTMPPAGEDGIVAQGDSLIRIVGNTVTGPAEYGSIAVHNARRVDIDTNTVTGGIEAGIYTWSGYSIDTLYVRDNVVSNLGNAICCVSYNGAIVLDASNPSNIRAQVLRNRISDTRSNGIVLVRDFGDTVTVLVDSNTVRRADSVGIWVRFYSKASVRKNAIDSVGLDAVQVNPSAVLPMLVNENNFSRSRRYGVYNTLSTLLLNAENNWWNDPNGPRGAFGSGTSTAGDSVSQYVDWDPPSASAHSTLLPTAPALVAALPVRGTATSSLTAPSVWQLVTRLELDAAPPERQPLRWPVPPVLYRAFVAGDRETPAHLRDADRVQGELRQARSAERIRRLEERVASRAERERRLADLRAVREATRAQPPTNQRPW